MHPCIHLSTPSTRDHISVPFGQIGCILGVNDKYHGHLISYKAHQIGILLSVFTSTHSIPINFSKIVLKFRVCYPPTKSEGYSFGVVRASVRPFRPSVHTFCLSGTISQYLLVRFDSFLVQMISTMNSQYPISLVKIDPLTLE